MRVIYLFLLILSCFQPVSFASDFIEIDLTKKVISFVDFYLEKLRISGDISFNLTAKNGARIVDIEGEEVFLGQKHFPWIKGRFIQRGTKLTVNYLRSPEFLVKGKILLDTGELSLELSGSWQEESSLCSGRMTVLARIWGRVSDYLSSGTLTLENGRYKTKNVNSFSVNFFGKPPLLNITDSKIILKDGSIYEIEGTLNVKDFKNLFPQATFVSRKVSLGDWEVLSEKEENAGIKKKVDERVDVLFNAYDKENDFMRSGAEVRYNLEKDNFLRLRMQETEAIVGFERRTEF
ncbi:MAG: hypothetical protein PHV17_05205 [Candidatus Omnitrophica bacterium]|nr:hypothetical protein [Candidatus Omnitrophota bacterium]